MFGDVVVVLCQLRTRVNAHSWGSGYPDFGRLAGVFPDQTGNEVAWQAVFQLGNELKSAPGSHFKVSSASNSVQKVEVIG